MNALGEWRQDSAFDQLLALAIIAKHVRERAPWFAGEPFEVPREIYDSGKREMQIKMKARGFPLPRLPGVEAEHFVLFSVMILPKESNG